MKATLILICLLTLTACTHDDTNDEVMYTNEALHYELDLYAFYHEHTTDAQQFITDMLTHYGTGTFPHDEYNYSLAKGQLFTLKFQDEQHPNRVFMMDNHNSGRTRKFNGLGNILDALAQLDDRDEAFIGNFMIAMLQDNGVDMSHAFTGAEAFQLFEFKKERYHYFGRYTLQVNFKNDIGHILWDKNIRFPEFLNDPETVNTVKQLAKNDFKTSIPKGNK